MTRPQEEEVALAVTGIDWMGGGVGSVQSAIENLFEEAAEEIQIAAYRITEGASGAFEILEKALQKGVKVTLLVNRFDDQPEYTKDTIRRLSRKFHYFTALDFHPSSRKEDLHAKVIISDRTRAIIGSPNLTWKGMVMNHEIAVVLFGTPAADVASLVDRLVRSPRCKRIVA